MLRWLAARPGLWLGLALVAGAALVYPLGPLDEARIRDACAEADVGFCLPGLWRAFAPFVVGFLLGLAALSFATLALPLGRRWATFARAGAGVLALALAVPGLAEALGGVQVCEDSRCVAVYVPGTGVMIGVSLVGILAGLAFLARAWREHNEYDVT